MDTIDHVSHLWRHAKLPLQALQDLGLTGSAAALPSSFAVSKAAQASIALAALAAALYGSCAPATGSRCRWTAGMLRSSVAATTTSPSTAIRSFSATR